MQPIRWSITGDPPLPRSTAHIGKFIGETEEASIEVGSSRLTVSSDQRIVVKFSPAAMERIRLSTSPYGGRLYQKVNIALPVGICDRERKGRNDWFRTK